jgi:hypothetical protein
LNRLIITNALAASHNKNAVDCAYFLKFYTHLPIYNIMNETTPNKWDLRRVTREDSWNGRSNFLLELVGWGPILVKRTTDVFGKETFEVDTFEKVPTAQGAIASRHAINFVKGGVR